jgi:hypothetical protein
MNLARFPLKQSIADQVFEEDLNRALLNCFENLTKGKR